MNKCDMIKRWIPIIFVLLVLTSVASAISYPHLTGYVNDNANIFSDEYKKKITDLAERINKNTTVEIAVLTIESLEDNDIDNYAVNTFRENGVGKKDKNNGLLILIAKKERKYRFEVGYGLEGTIPDAMKVPIGDKIMVPHFKKGEYGEGVYDSMLAIEGLVTNNTEVISKYGLNKTSEIPDWVIIIVIIIIILFIIIVLIAAGGGGGGYGGGGWSGGGSSGGSDSGFGGFGGGSSGGGGFGGGW